MILDYTIFKDAIYILKSNEIINVFNSLISVSQYRLLIEKAYKEKMYLLRKMVVSFKKQEMKTQVRKENIENKFIVPWIPLLRKEQQNGIFKDVKKTIVNEITGGKRQMDETDSSLDELWLRLKEKAKETSDALKEINKIKRQEFTLKIALELDTFLKSVGYSAKDIAEFEYEKYFDLFRKGRN